MAADILKGQAVNASIFESAGIILPPDGLRPNQTDIFLSSNAKEGPVLAAPGAYPSPLTLIPELCELNHQPSALNLKP